MNCKCDTTTAWKPSWPEGRLNGDCHCMNREHGSPGKVRIIQQYAFDNYIPPLRLCTKSKSLAKGRKIHAHIIRNGFVVSILLENTLIYMYANCGSMSDASQLFETMHDRNVYTWTIMITGYAQEGDSNKTLYTLSHMELYGLNPNKVTYLSSLSACATGRALECGKYVHAKVINAALHLDRSVANILIAMYSKCGDVNQATCVFGRMPSRDIISWNVLFTAYNEYIDCHRVVELFWQMQQCHGIHANGTTYVNVLVACSSAGSLAHGKMIHAHLITEIQSSDIFVENSLLSMYANCTSIYDACHVFRSMAAWDMVSWNTLLSGYAQQKLSNEATIFFTQMQHHGVKPDEASLVNILSAYRCAEVLQYGRYMHANIILSLSEQDSIVQNAIVGMYAKCGSLYDSWHVFARMQTWDFVSWNALIHGYAECGNCHEVINLFKLMHELPFRKDKVGYADILGACSSLEWVKYIDAHILTFGLTRDIFIQNMLVCMYQKFNNLHSAYHVFDSMHVHNICSWNALISGYGQSGNGMGVIQLFRQMQQSLLEPDKFTYASVLKACASEKLWKWGKYVHARTLCRIKSKMASTNNSTEALEIEEIHAQLIKIEPLIDVSVENTLVDMYVKCGDIMNACDVFDRMVEQNVISWNIIISGCGQCEGKNKAIHLLCQVEQQGFKPDNATYVNVLSSFAIVQSLECGKHVHANFLKSGLELDVAVVSALAGMYARWGSLNDAHQIFGWMPEWDVISWNLIISVYAQDGHGTYTMKLFWQMQQEGITPNAITFACTLSACATVGCLEWGIAIHDCLSKLELLYEPLITNSLISMYAKCGSVESAHKIFDKTHFKDMVSWNAIISGYAENGMAKESLVLLKRMQEHGWKPNNITFISILAACSHVGLIEEGHHFAYSMNQIYKIELTNDHLACVVDLLGRLGYLTEVFDLINSMAFQLDNTVWLAFLNACNVHGDLKLAQYVSNEIITLYPDNGEVLILLSNIYAAAKK